MAEQRDSMLAELRQNFTMMRNETAELNQSFREQDARLLTVEGALSDGQRRRMQGAEEPEPEPVRGDYVLQITRNVSRCGAPGAGNIGGHFDKSRCADHAFQQCNREACLGYNGDHSGGGAGTHGGGKHRRAQAARRCKPADLAARATEITAECCDEPSEDCTGGTPHTCNAGCAAIFLPFWAECRSALGEDSGQFEAAVALCEAAVPALPAPGTSLSLAEQLNVQ